MTASDVADDFIKATQSQGLKTINFNALEDDFSRKILCYFLLESICHFTKEDAQKIIQKAYDALENNGIFIFNAMNRETKNIDSEWLDFDNEYHLGAERYYNYFTKTDLDDIIQQTKFQIANFEKEGGENNNKWLIYVLKNKYKNTVIQYITIER